MDSNKDKVDQILETVHNIDKRLVAVETRLLGLLEWRVAVVAAVCGGLASLLLRFL